MCEGVVRDREQYVLVLEIESQRPTPVQARGTGLKSIQSDRRAIFGSAV